MYKFADVFEFQRKSKIKAGDGKKTGRFPFYTSSAELSKYVDNALFDGENLVFGTGGNASVHFAEGRFSVSTDCLVAQPKTDDINPKFFYHYLSGNIRILEEGFKGAGLKHISKSYISDITLPELSRTRQGKIVSVLDQAESLRQKRKEQLSLLDDYLKSVFLDKFGDPVINNKKWPSCSLEDLCLKIIDCPHSTPEYVSELTDYPCIRSSDLQNGFTDYSTTKYVSQEVYNERVKRCVPKSGDVIYCREGARFGASGYLEEGIKGCLGQRTMLFRTNPEVATSEYLWGLISSNGIFHQAQQLAGGAASPRVNVKDIKNYCVYCAPIEKQKIFSETFKIVRNAKQKLRASLGEMDNHFNALMQRYFG